MTSPDLSVSLTALVRAGAVGALFVAAACGRSERHEPAVTPDESGPVAGAAGGGHAGAVTDPVVHAGEGGMAGAPAVTPEVDPVTPSSPQEQAYLDFLKDLARAGYERMVECFGVSDSEYLVVGDPERLLAEMYAQRAALRLGTKAFAADRAADCLQAIAEAACQEVPSLSALTGVCAVLLGQVPPGGACLGEGDCRDAASFQCYGDQGGPQCVRHCVARTQAAPAGALDEPCGPGGCLSGLYCRRTQKVGFEGVCRPYTGEPCEGIWQCPYFHTCDSSNGSSSLGTCTVGLGIGESCQIIEDYNGRDSNCAHTLSCYSDGGGDLTCAPGRELGEACGREPETGRFIKCHVGYCSSAEPGGSSTCVERKSIGEPCAGQVECRSQLCQSGICGPVERRIGSICSIGDDCGLESFCWIPRDARDVAAQGVCQAFKRVGETCSDLEPCEPLSACVAGVCEHCPDTVGL